MDIFYKKLMLLTLTLVCCGALWSQESVSKKIEKTYPMTNAGELGLDNKYGDITITGWDKNSLKITMDIEVTHKKKDIAEDLLERINADIQTSGDLVSFTSEIAEKRTSFFSRYFNKANPFDFDKSNVKINYTVYLPTNAELDITNKFGDLVIEEWTGKLKANVQHGDVWVNDNITNANIELKFGKLNAKSITYGNIRMKNGKIHMEESKDLRINSNGSTIDIGRISSLELYSSKDEVAFENIGSIVGDLKFSTIYIDTLNNDIGLTMKLVDFRVSKIIERDASITIQQESSDVSLNISDLAFKFEAVLEQGLLRLPKTFTNMKTKVIDKTDKIREINATYGNDPSGKISFTGRKGVIVLREL